MFMALLVPEENGAIIFSFRTVRNCRMALHGQSLEILEIGEDDAYYLISKLCNSSGGCCRLVFAKTSRRKQRHNF
jgi:hypothetical protein